MNLLLALLCCNTCGLLNNELIDNSSPKVVIIGAGAAGIAAATRLLENGFTDVTILEAENRIGGRIHSIKIGDYMVDMGGQWVHGEKDNVAFELAWPLGLIERREENFVTELKFFKSTGSMLSPKIKRHLEAMLKLVENNLTYIERFDFGESFGKYAEPKYIESFKDHPEISFDLYEPLLHLLNLIEMVSDGANSWHDVSAKGLRDYAECEGDQSINWKNRTYSTILDILMKKYPNPGDELPVLENTQLNTKVKKIDYNEGSDYVTVSTANGELYLADHVIFTPSLGVLQVAYYDQLFDPPLPENKATAINTIGFGHVAKIWLYYDNPWWDSTGNKIIVNFIVWTEEDRFKIIYNPNKRWMYGIVGVATVEHRPKLLCLWMGSDYSSEMESIPEDMFRNQVTEFLEKFYGHAYRVTKPTEIIRTSWNKNENFQGTYSYLSVEADVANVSAADLAEPIMRNNKPILQFAGEATSEHYSTVHGAIDSGWREADRLIDLYSRKKNIQPFLEELISNSGIKID